MPLSCVLHSLQTMKILICDDHAIFRAGLRTVLGELGREIELLESGDAEEALAIVAAGGVDLVLLDLEMPGMHGASALRELRQSHPNVAIVIVSASEDTSDVRSALDGGASGFIPKSSGAPILRAALELVFSGGVYIPPQLLSQVPANTAETKSPARRDERLPQLTPRQREVLILMSRGLSNREIGETLGIAAGTVKAHAAALYEILDVSNRTEATLIMSELSLDPSLDD